eukprot:SAG22_NODE_11730_length_471_cov_1.870968_1_plen_99_part_10
MAAVLWAERVPSMGGLRMWAEHVLCALAVAVAAALSRLRRQTDGRSVERTSRSPHLQARPSDFHCSRTFRRIIWSDVPLSSDISVTSRVEPPKLVLSDC